MQSPTNIQRERTKQGCSMVIMMGLAGCFHGSVCVGGLPRNIEFVGTKEKKMKRKVRAFFLFYLVSERRNNSSSIVLLFCVLIHKYKWYSNMYMYFFIFCFFYRNV